MKQSKSSTKDLTLNVPLVTTFIVDYIFIGIFVGAWCASCCTDWVRMHDDDSVNNAFLAAFLIMLIPIKNIFREDLYCYLFKDSPAFSHCKTEFSMFDLPNLCSDVVQSLLTVAIFVAVPAYMGHVQMGMVNDDIFETFLVVSRGHWISYLCKDNTAMRFAHPWMHKRENHWMHKHQQVSNVCRKFSWHVTPQHPCTLLTFCSHMGGRNSIQIQSFVFDFIDLLFEFSLGPVVAIPLSYFLFGSAQIHLLTILFLLWTDNLAHSINPYTQNFASPLVDWMLKPNISHQLHHAYPTHPRYMTVITYRQLVGAKELAYDVEKYNKIMKANVDFRLFIPRVVDTATSCDKLVQP